MKNFIINKKSSIKSSKLLIFENLLFDDVPLAAKQAYLECLEKQIIELGQMRQKLSENIILKQQEQEFLKEVQNIKAGQNLDHNIVNKSMLLSQFMSEQQKIDSAIIEQSYLKDLQQMQELQSSNHFVPFENEFL